MTIDYQAPAVTQVETLDGLLTCPFSGPICDS